MHGKAPTTSLTASMAEQATDPTLAHLLCLPPLLHPLSPQLAALHLARVRLLLSLPSPHPSLIWCDKCGGLRESSKSKKRKRVYQCTLCGIIQGAPKPIKSTTDSFPNARKTRRMAKLAPPPETASPVAAPSKPKPLPPTLLSTPALAHVPTSHPVTPVYPVPPPLVQPQPGAGTNSSKKKKKSGLAKLLAENKARKEESLGGGNWGLG
jgi:hypothetical protein